MALPQIDDMATPQLPAPDPGDSALDDARQRFITTFATQWDSIRILVDQVEATGPGGPVAALIEIANRLSTLARTIGFPTVGARASELEELMDGVSTGHFDGLRAHVVLDAMLEAFNKDLASSPLPAARSAVVRTPAEAIAGEALPVAVAVDVEPPAVLVARTAVIAEDDPDVTRLVDAQMRAAGYTTFLAFDGKEALAAVRAHAPDVLVLDLMMPKLSGFDVLTELRDGPLPRPQIIVLSGLGREEDVLRVFELGADDYMAKPFNPQELMARIARLLKKCDDHASDS